MDNEMLARIIAIVHGGNFRHQEPHQHPDPHQRQDLPLATLCPTSTPCLTHENKTAVPPLLQSYILLLLLFLLELPTSSKLEYETKSKRLSNIVKVHFNSYIMVI
uniref:Uncharacterized protein n=1 Tax=Cacopsylla melanoneura TaxID=428564 RepID=A0A8D8T441_9HEMI